jgi:hypothetical protein
MKYPIDRRRGDEGRQSDRQEAVSLPADRNLIKCTRILLITVSPAFCREIASLPELRPGGGRPRAGRGVFPEDGDGCFCPSVRREESTRQKKDMRKPGRCKHFPDWTIGGISGQLHIHNQNETDLGCGWSAAPRKDGNIRQLTNPIS